MYLKTEEANTVTLFATEMYLKAEEIQHERTIYSFFDLLGDLGGVTEVIMVSFGFMLFPISEHSFIL